MKVDGGEKVWDNGEKRESKGLAAQRQAGGQHVCPARPFAWSPACPIFWLNSNPNYFLCEQAPTPCIRACVWERQTEISSLQFGPGSRWDRRSATQLPERPGTKSLLQGRPLVWISYWKDPLVPTHGACWCAYVIWQQASRLICWRIGMGCGHLYSSCLCECRLWQRGARKGAGCLYARLWWLAVSVQSVCACT